MKIARNIIILFSCSVLILSCNKDKDNNEPSMLAEVSTMPVTSVKDDSAIFAGNVTSEGQSAVVQRGFCWSTHPLPTSADSTSDNGFGPGIFTYNAANLESNTIYYVRAYALNAYGTSYGNEVAFKTEYKIGDIGPGGGYVFYLNPDGGGLEMAPESTEAVGEWGCYPVSISGTSTAIGTGQANTTAIVNGCSQASIAAKICNDLVVNGKNDWYLPSKDELYQIYVNLSVPGIVVFVGDRYWSSSENNAQTAWRMDLQLGIQNGNTKSNVYYVRAIRSF